MRNRKHLLVTPQATLVHLDQLLDEALQETFPASDPIAVYTVRAPDRVGEGPGADIEAVRGHPRRHSR
jgi:hypothetical protein